MQEILTSLEEWACRNDDEEAAADREEGVSY